MILGRNIEEETGSFCCRHISVLPPHSRQLRQLQWLSPSYSPSLSTLCAVQQVNALIHSQVRGRWVDPNRTTAKKAWYPSSYVIVLCMVPGVTPPSLPQQAFGSIFNDDVTFYSTPRINPLWCRCSCYRQSTCRQSTRPFLQSSEWAPPLPHPQASVPPSPLWFGGRDTHACGRGDVGVHFKRGDRHCGSLGTRYVCTLSSYLCQCCKLQRAECSAN
jgi:hypothetical protein